MRERPSRRFLPRAAAIAFTGALVLACGTRGPLDADIGSFNGNNGNGNGNGTGDDSGSTTPPDQLDAGGGDDTTGPDATTIVDSATPIDAPHEASLINCGTCVLTSCGTQIFACISDPTCQQELQCIATTCLAGGDGGGGGLGNLGCFTSCAGGDLTKLATLVQILTCITQSCGSDCGSVLGGLGGLGGGKAMAPAPAPAPEAGRVIFSAFPEICGAR